MEKYKGKDLAAMVSGGNCEKLIEMITLNKSKKSPFTFKEAVKELCPEDIDKMCEDLDILVMKQTESIFENKENANSSDKKVCNDVSQLVQAAIEIAYVILGKETPVPQGILQMVVFLNGIILEIPSNMDSLKNSIAYICEKMYHMNCVSQNQYFTFNTILYLLKRSLNPKAAKKEVKRVYVLRSMIPKVLNMEAVDPNDVWELLKKCAASPLYLSMLEGQKVIALAMTIDIDLVLEIHNVIKKCLPACTLKQGAGYGKVYFEAWSHAVKTNHEKLKNEIEIACLQDIVLLAINGRQRSSVLAVRKLLGQFHCQKKELYVAKMLYFLYQPILWRYLKDPDGLVRAHAAQLFLDVFPLEDPDVKVVTTDLELNEQMLMIQDLLEDDFPIVRSAAIIGLCISMSVNWELFPQTMLNTYFKLIVNRLSRDSSSAEVRCAVAKGFKVLMENPLTIETLQRALPKLQGLFHDVSDSVRVAFCQLLLRVKKISAIKYYNIVPLDHLLARLEEDPVVGKSIVNLIHNSYFPKAEGPEVWFARCCEMVKTDRGASRVFFTHVSSYVGIDTTVKFMIQTVKSVHFYIRTKHSGEKRTSSNKSNDNDNSMEEADALEEAAGFNNPDVVCGLLDAVAILWLSILPSLEKPENKNYLKLLVGKLSKCLGDLTLYYKETPVWHSVFYLSSLLPTANTPILASLCFWKLKTLSADATPNEYCILLDCLCNQDEGAQLLGLIKEWIEAGLECSDQAPPTKKGRKSSKQADSKKLGKALSVQMLHRVVDRRPCQKPLLKRHPDSFAQFLPLTNTIQKNIELCIESKAAQEEADFLIELLYALVKIASLLHGEGKCDAVKYIEDLMQWMQDKFLKYMTPESDKTDMSCSRILSENSSKVENSPLNASRRKSLTRKSARRSVATCADELQERIVFGICKHLCCVAGDLTSLGFCNVKSMRFMKFTVQLLNIERGGPLLLGISKFLFKHITYGNILSVKEKDTCLLHLVPDCYLKVIQSLHNETYLLSIPALDAREVQSTLSGCLQTLQQHGQIREICTDLMFAIAKNFVVGIQDSLKDCNIFHEKCGPFDKISITKSSAFILTTLCMKPKIIVFFLQQLQKYVMKFGRDIHSWITCCIIIFQIFALKTLSKNVCKEVKALVGKMGDILQEQYPQSDQNTSKEFLGVDNSKDQSEFSFEKHCYFEFKTLKNQFQQKLNPIAQKKVGKKDKEKETE